MVAFRAQAGLIENRQRRPDQKYEKSDEDNDCASAHLWLTCCSSFERQLTEHGTPCSSPSKKADGVDKP
jgi:hypothetical protein